MSGFVDQEKLKMLTERVEKMFLELGMTIGHLQVGIHPETGDPILQVVAIVRETAFEQMSEDLDVKKTLAQMMAADAQHALDEKVEAIEAAFESGDFMDVLLGNRDLVECSHERIHEGLCLDCGKEVLDEA